MLMHYIQSLTNVVALETMEEESEAAEEVEPEVEGPRSKQRSHYEERLLNRYSIFKRDT
jgi:hypothetical protein